MMLIGLTEANEVEGSVGGGIKKKSESQRVRRQKKRMKERNKKERREIQRNKQEQTKHKNERQ